MGALPLCTEMPTPFNWRTANPLNMFGEPAFLFDTVLYQYKNGTAFTNVFMALTGLTFTRALAAYAPNSAGVLQLFGSGAPRITDRGLLIEGARTNKCTNYNAALPALVTPSALATFNAAVTNLTATGGDGNTLFGIVDDTAALAAAGLSNAVTNGRVIKIDNSAGAATAFINVGGTTGNTNSHTMSSYVRVDVPATLIPMTFTGGSGNNTSLTTAYQRYVQTFTPGAGTNVSILRCPAGTVAYFILNQLEEGAFVSSPIPVAGASVTRPADVCSIAVSGISYPATLFAEFERLVDTGGNEDFLQLDAGSNNERAALWVAGGGADTFQPLMIAGGVTQYSNTVAGALSTGVVYRGASRFATDDCRGARSGTLNTQDTLATLPSTPTAIRIGGDVSGGLPPFGFIKRAACYSNSAFSDAQLQAITA